MPEQSNMRILRSNNCVPEVLFTPAAMHTRALCRAESRPRGDSRVGLHVKLDHCSAASSDQLHHLFPELHRIDEHVVRFTELLHDLFAFGEQRIGLNLGCQAATFSSPKWSTYDTYIIPQA